LHVQKHHRNGFRVTAKDFVKLLLWAL